MLPKGTSGILETEMRLQSNDFCPITFRTNRPHCRPVYAASLCKHCSSHHSTLCRKVKLQFKAQCWKMCWLPESLTSEPKFSHTFSTAPHTWERNLYLCTTLVSDRSVIEAWDSWTWNTCCVLLKLWPVIMKVDLCLSKITEVTFPLAFHVQVYNFNILWTVTGVVPRAQLITSEECVLPASED